MTRAISWIKKEPVLFAALLCALVSVFFGAPAADYPGYLDYDVLMLLFCLMAVVAGLETAGLFDRTAQTLPRTFRTQRSLALALLGVCFFGAMLFTNDVALIAFVPLALKLFDEKQPRARMFLVSAMAVAANLGSLVTPVGNPQNLFLYSFYGLSISGFFAVTLPLGGVCLLLCVLLGLYFRKTPARKTAQVQIDLDKRRIVFYFALFALCLLAVLRVLPVWLCFVLTLLAILLFDRARLMQVDYALLVTFVCFFVFSGNLKALPGFGSLLARLLTGRECLVAALLSQISSTVPAAVLLAPFTQNGAGLLLGVNIGGLGTPIASLASLIAFKLYLKAPGAKAGAYLAVFSVMNFALLLLLLLLFA